TVTITPYVDVVAPVAVCVANSSLTVVLNANGQATISPQDVDGGSSDNFSNVTLALSQSTFTCADLGANQVILSVTDEAGNVASCTSSIVVVDNMAPQVPNSFALELDENGLATISTSLDEAGIIDNCGIAALDLSQDQFDEVGTSTVSITATDLSGNTTSKNTRVTINPYVDVVPPTATCVASASITLVLDENGQATITPEDVDNGSIDNFSDVTLTLSQSAFTCADLGGNVVTLFVTDEAGNVTSCNTSINVVDNLAPQIPVTFELELNEQGVARISTSLEEAGIMDNCAIATLDVSQDEFNATGTSNVTITAADASGNSSTVNAQVTITDGPTVSGLFMVEAGTNNIIRELMDGDIINLYDPEVPEYSIVAIGDDQVESIQFFLNGRLIKTENDVPYAIAGDRKKLPRAFDLSVGTHTISAVGYSENRATGEAGSPKTVTIEVVNNAQATQFDLVDTDQDKVLRTLRNGDVIDLAEGNLSIAALISTEAIGSVQFLLNGEPLRVENMAPYAIAGDHNGDFNAFDFAPGDYTLTAIPFSESQGRGSAGKASSIDFTVVNNQAVSSFVIVDRDTKKEIKTLENGDILDLSDPKFDNIVIYALVNGKNVGSVVSTLNGQVIDVDNKAPYSIHGPFAPGSYTLTSTPFASKDGKGNAGQSLTVDFEVISPVRIQRFDLVDAAKDTKIRTLKDGDVIDLSEAELLTIQAVANADIVKSVEIFIDGKFERLERSAPHYSIAGDRRGDFHPFHFVPGQYTLTAIPYADSKAKGTPGAAHSISFTVKAADVQAISAFFLVETKANTTIGALEDGDVLHFSKSVFDHLSIIAKTDGDRIGSVVFFLDGKKIKTENYEPYAIAGDNRGDYKAFQFEAGNHELTAIAFTGRHGTGTAGGSLTVTFEVPGGSARTASAQAAPPMELSATVYPNPVKDRLSVFMSSEKSDVASIQLINLSGKVILEDVLAIQPGREDFSFDLSSMHLTSGQYILRIHTAHQGTLIKKVLKR
ncbi:MAG: T9SS type A sorting domain-containing protein, partial [Bacteroidota bacterium]